MFGIGADVNSNDEISAESLTVCDAGFGDSYESRVVVGRAGDRATLSIEIVGVLKAELVSRVCVGLPPCFGRGYGWGRGGRVEGVDLRGMRETMREEVRMMRVIDRKARERRGKLFIVV